LGERSKKPIQILLVKADIALAQRNLKEAIIHLELALELGGKVKLSPLTALFSGKAYMRMAWVYYTKEEFYDSEDYFVKAYEEYRKHRGDQDKKSQDLLSKAAELQVRNGEISKAISNYTYLLSWHERTLSQWHKHIYEDHKQLGRCYERVPNFRTALFHFEKALGIAKMIYTFEEGVGRDEDYYEGAFCKYKIGSVQLHSGNPEGALVFLESAQQYLH